MGDLSKHFNRIEFTCKDGCGKADMSPKLIEILEGIRNMYDKPMTITSGFRCFKHNEAEGGKSDSAHTAGLAVDIAVHDSVERYNLIMFAMQQGIQRIGIAKTFIHIDIDETKPQDVVWLY